MDKKDMYELVYSAVYEALGIVVNTLEEKGIVFEDSLKYILQCAEYVGENLPLFSVDVFEGLKEERAREFFFTWDGDFS